MPELGPHHALVIQCGRDLIGKWGVDLAVAMPPESNPPFRFVHCKVEGKKQAPIRDLLSEEN